MTDVVDQYATGEEYMSRYQAVPPQADVYGWRNHIRLKGIDVAVYAYALFRCLARLAARAGIADGSAHRQGRADWTADAVRARMRDAERGMLSDVDLRSVSRTGIAAAVRSYPYVTDIVTDVHLAGLEQNPLDPRQFWTVYPVPSSTVDDPLPMALDYSELLDVRVRDTTLGARLDGGYPTVTTNDALHMVPFGESIVIPR